MVRGSGLGDHVHGAALLRALGRELDLAVDQREQGVVAAEADARTRVELGAALADDDVAGVDRLAAIDLHAEVLRVGVAAVARGAYALFMCHDCVSLLLVATGNAGDLDFGVMLPVAHLLAMVLAAAELHDAHLVGAAVGLDGGGDGCPIERDADLDALAVAKHEHVVERDLIACFDVQQLDAQRLALHHAVLLSACYQDCIHDQASYVVIVVACHPWGRQERNCNWNRAFGSNQGEWDLYGCASPPASGRFKRSDGSQGTVRCKDSIRHLLRCGHPRAEGRIVSFTESLCTCMVTPAAIKRRKATPAPRMTGARACRIAPAPPVRPDRLRACPPRHRASAPRRIHIRIPPVRRPSTPGRAADPRTASTEVATATAWMGPTP